MSNNLVYWRFSPTNIDKKLIELEIAENTITRQNERAEKESYTFDGVWDTNISSNNFFTSVGQAPCDNILNGDTISIVMYGQSSQNKTDCMV